MKRALASLGLLVLFAGTAWADAAPPPPPAETMLKWLKDGCTFANARRPGEVCDVCFMEDGFEGPYCAFPQNDREPGGERRDYALRCRSATTKLGSYEIRCRRAEPCEEQKVARPGEECYRSESADGGYYANHGYQRRCTSRVRAESYTVWCMAAEPEKPASKPTTSTTPETAPAEVTLASESKPGCQVGGAGGGGGAALLLLGLAALLARRRRQERDRARATCTILEYE